MLINSANLDSLFKGYSAKYRDSYNKTPAYWDKVAMKMPSDGRDQTYGFLGTFPNLREWIGPRVVNGLSAHGFTITNKKFESTVEISRDDIADDRYGIFGPLFEEMGLAAKVHPDQLIFGLLAAGFTTNAYDGQSFFDTDHPVINAAGAVVNVSNSGGGAGTPWFLLDTSRAVKPLIFQMRDDYEMQSLTNANTDERVFLNDSFLYGIRARVNAGLGFWQMAYGSRQTLNAANYAAARAAMMDFRADGGRPLGVKPTVLVVPPSLEAQALAILNTETESGGGTNVWRGTAELIVTPHVTV